MTVAALPETPALAMPVRKVACAAVPDVPHATWSQALVVGAEVVMSGQTAGAAAQQAAAAGTPMDAYQQALVCLRKLQALVEAAGGGVHNIVKLTLYLTNIADREAVGRARRDFFADALPGATFPASTLVAVSALVQPELRVEVDAIARLDADLRQAVLATA